MTPRRQSIAPALVTVAALMVLFETLYFARQQPGYGHVANTISELGETGAPHARLVAFGFFLPVGLLIWLALWLVHRAAPGRDIWFALAAMSCLGTGYAAAAFFPCDPGGPLFGTWRTEVHNVLGFIDYEGTGIGFLLVARCCARRSAKFPAVAFLIAGVLVLLGLALLSLETAYHLRGAIQRVTEVIQFTGIFFACFIAGKMEPSLYIHQSNTLQPVVPSPLPGEG
ncbi:MAG TPA: DUF998 domain-containing protein [Verrucomicrobiae bacterium]|nr:DUF998 domain-containing protein [Verrucomicrobiae bacterium]